MLITSSLLIDALIFTLLFLWLLYRYLTRNNDYWERRGVPFVKPTLFFGNSLDIFLIRKSISDWLIKFYKSSNAPYLGIFVLDEPYLIINSPELIKQILIKDFNVFSDRTIATPNHNSLMQNFLFLQKNPQWREARSKMTQVFSTGKIKVMFPIMKSVGDEFVSHLKANAGILDAKKVLLKYGTELTARCFFGIKAHSFENDNAIFNVISREMFGPTSRNGIAQMSYFFRQNFVHLFHFEFVAKWIQDYLQDAFWKVMKQREETGVRVNDLVDVLGDIIKTDPTFIQDKNKIVGQVLQFYVGGYETTSTTISFALYEMAKNPDVQTHLRKDIFQVIEKYKTLSYENLKELPYLDMCIYETIRKYPVLPFLDRRCNKEYKIPGTDLVLDKGQAIYIPLHALHLNEKYFPESQKFDPERFANNADYNKEGLVFMPFGSGPRVCIGERFGFLSTKLSLANILSNFEVSVCPETPNHIEFDPRSFLLACKGALLLDFKPLSN